MQRNVAVIVEVEKKNFYSLTSIIATFDENKELQSVPLFIETLIDNIKIKNYLEKYEFLIIAMSFRTAQIGYIYDKLNNIYNTLSQSDLKRILFVAGGSHATGDPESTLKLGFDFAFIGEGELSFIDFVQRLKNGDDIYSTKGIAYLEKEMERVVVTPAPSLIKLDNYPFFSVKRKLFPPLEITRGCAFGCTFCQVPSMYHKKVRHRSTEKIVEIVKWLANNKMGDIRFITPNSFGYMAQKPREVKIEAIEHLLSSIREVKGVRKIFYGTFPGEVRPETVSVELMEIVKPLITNRRISIGLQSGNDEILENIRRGHTVDEGLQAIDIIMKMGFRAIVDFIYGLPNATLEQEMDSIDVMKKLIAKGAIVRPHVFMPLPGTQLEHEGYGQVPREVRVIFGNMASNGQIEGSWTVQEKYAKEAWDTIKRVEAYPKITRKDSQL